MKRSNIVLIHILFWVARLAPSVQSERLMLALYVSFNVVTILTFYLNYFLIMPLLFGRKKYWGTALAWLALFLFFVFARYLLEETLYPSWFGFRNYVAGTTISYYIIDNISYGLPAIFLSALLWLLVSFIKSKNENTTLKLEKNKAELNFLKSQVNPHFLFNNLNSIYSLVYNQSDLALPAIQQLSDMMRYMVREATLDRVSLSQELKYVQDLIGLQALRVSGTAQVKLEVIGTTDGKNIAPLLLIPFVENGFKHGDITDAAQPFIIRLTVRENWLELHTSNKISRSNKDAGSGVGLNNVQQRLALLYPDAYTLTCVETNGTYICNLKLKLHA